MKKYVKKALAFTLALLLAVSVVITHPMGNVYAADLPALPAGFGFSGNKIVISDWSSLPKGNYPLDTSLAATTNYKALPISGTVTVTKKERTVTLEPVAGITYGDATSVAVVRLNTGEENPAVTLICDPVADQGDRKSVV